jgi:TetR/AcrR family transcriptional regulator, regulator of mycofactocin system
LEVKRTRSGRPPSTSPQEVARAAFELFARDGFEATTVEAIAAAAHTSRRTVFRYFASKNDIVWGEFDWVLQRLRDDLAATSPDEPLLEALGRAVVASNHYEVGQLPELRLRMTLITTVPALQAHSMLRYREWRQVVADWVALRLDLAESDLVPQVLAFAALGTAMAAFVSWVNDPGADLERNLEQGFALLASGYRL